MIRNTEEQLLNLLPDSQILHIDPYSNYKRMNKESNKTYRSINYFCILKIM